MCYFPLFWAIVVFGVAFPPACRTLVAGPSTQPSDTAEHEFEARKLIREIRALQGRLDQVNERLSQERRKFSDKLKQAAAEMENIPADAPDREARIDRATRSFLDVNEQLDRLRTLLREIDDAQWGYDRAPFGPPRPVLQGVIQFRKNVDGTEYPTIALGSKQGVTKTMVFKVIGDNLFLGYFVVDRVGETECAGHLAGPHQELILSGSHAASSIE